MANKKKLTREERLEKKRQAERLRYQKIKNDPDKYALQQEKERKKYERKKDKGVIKTVDKMTPREQRKARKMWKEKSRERRRRLAITAVSNVPMKPPSSGNEAQRPATQRSSDRRLQEAKRKSDRQRRLRNETIKKQAQRISKLKTTVARYKKRLQRLKPPKNLTPFTKVNEMLDSPSNRETVKQKLLFGEVLAKQLKQNFSTLSTSREKKVFRRMISGKLTHKYQILRNEKDMKPLKKTKRELRFRDPKRKIKRSYEKLKMLIVNFFTYDSNSRMCAGKRDFVTKKGERKQKRVLLNTMFNLHKSFMKESGIIIGYSSFCRLRPFWITPPRCGNRDTCLCATHANMDLILAALFQAKIISVSNHQSLLNQICCNRYNEQCLARECQNCKNKELQYKEFDNSAMISYKRWESVSENVTDPKTNKTQKVTKCLKKTVPIYPHDLIIHLETKLGIFLQHEVNIVHQYNAMRTIKRNLTEKDAIIHMDFSENYQTKYAEEIQAFHFGGSRQQISLHTVVTYTKDNAESDVKPTCYCTMSTNLSHSPPAVWAHLQPILDKLPPTVENLHFLSDGPVTQYRNKTMFYILSNNLQEFYPNVINFTWNYHEAGHGKGAPDGIGAVCKRTADRLVASGNDISALSDLSNAIETHCPNIKVLTIDDSEISLKENLLLGADGKIKAFPGTLRVHQVVGSTFLPNQIKMKTLSCFCNQNCSHFQIGTLVFASTKSRLRVDDVYGSNSELDEEPQPSTSASDKKYKNGDFLLVKLFLKSTEYRYVAMCTGVEEDDEIQVVFCKMGDNTGKLFNVDESDMSFITLDQIIDELPIPNLKMKGQRMFYAFQNSVDVSERA